MKVLVVSTKKSKLIPIVILLSIILIISGSIIGYFYLKKDKIIEEKKIEVIPMSNISFEINKITGILNKNNIIDMKFEDNNIYIKVTKKANIEPLIARYEDMLEIKYEKEFNLLKIRKKEIKKDKSKKEQLYDYINSKVFNKIKKEVKI